MWKMIICVCKLMNMKCMIIYDTNYDINIFPYLLTYICKNTDNYREICKTSVQVLLSED